MYYYNDFFHMKKLDNWLCDFSQSHMSHKQESSLNPEPWPPDVAGELSQPMGLD